LLQVLHLRFQCFYILCLALYQFALRISILPMTDKPGGDLVLDRYGHLIREVNTEQVRRLENMLGCVENFDSFSDSKNKSVRRMLEDFGKNESEGFVQPLPHKDLEAVVHA
ncbi:MAG: hypothetical protein MUO31_03900, partial [Thermodesulfovibrionales bacterium]|nr:hypothetical protein [Thermodesulfovibrionales bacterium]